MHLTALQEKKAYTSAVGGACWFCQEQTMKIRKLLFVCCCACTNSVFDLKQLSVCRHDHLYHDDKMTNHASANGFWAGFIYMYACVPVGLRAMLVH